MRHGIAAASIAAAFVLVPALDAGAAPQVKSSPGRNAQLTCFTRTDGSIRVINEGTQALPKRASINLVVVAAGRPDLRRTVVTKSAIAKGAILTIAKIRGARDCTATIAR